MQNKNYDPQYLDEILNFNTFKEIRDNPDTALELINDIYTHLPSEVLGINEDIKKSDFSVGKTLNGDGLRVYILDRSDNIYEIRYTADKKKPEYVLLKDKPSDLEMLFDSAKNARPIKEGQIAAHVRDFYAAEERSNNYHMLVNLYAHFMKPGKGRLGEEEVFVSLPKKPETTDYLESKVGKTVMEKLAQGGRDMTCEEAFAVHTAVQNAEALRIPIKTKIPDSVITKAYACIGN